MKKNFFKHNFYSRRKQYWLVFTLFAIGGISIFAIIFVAVKYRYSYLGVPSIDEIYNDWNKKDYYSVYEKTSTILDKRPFDGIVLSVHGFSAYYLFEEQTDLSVGFDYLSDSIISLRKAIHYVDKKDIPEIAYILGKAYYQKGYFYANLALKYLNIANSSNNNFPNLSEFRGMSASLLNRSNEAILAFSDALKNNPSDMVLFALAKSYLQVNDTDNAKMYLTETINKTEDVFMEINCRYLLGNIFITEKNIEKAKFEYQSMLEKDANSADAYYGLGVISELSGDMVKARSIWRKALKLDPLHAKTREKLKL